MDWFLSVFTLLSNCGLGWFKGVWWIWLIHSLNAVVWIFYSYTTNQYGLILLSVVTIIIDLISSWRAWRRTHASSDM